MKKKSFPPLVLIGFGNQAKAWALNLRDSGQQVYIALRKGSSSQAQVEAMGFPILWPETSALSAYQNFALLVPDHTHEEILQQSQEFIPENSRIIYAHGFSLHKNQLQKKFPTWNHLLFAPKSIASELRFQYETQGKISGVFSMEHSRSPQEDKEYLLQLAIHLGINAGPFETSFENETYADLFSEQTLLCSLIPYASLACYNFLVNKGIEKELAFLECWHELKLIVDTMVQVGPTKFFHMISPNALIGAAKGAKVLIDKDFLQKLESLLNDILQKKFYQEIDHADFEKTRRELLSFWENEDFTRTFEQMSPQLYS